MDNATSTARATWKGTTVKGKGTVSTNSPALSDTSMTWRARIGEEAGTTPEELLAAAHASCYSMALCFALDGAGYTPDEVKVEATATFGPEGDGFAVKGIELSVDAAIPGIDDSEFNKLAEGAKTGCPISAALKGNVDITLKTRLAAHH